MKNQPQPPPPRRRVLIVDDHPVVRDGLVQLVNAERDLVVCGTAINARDALTLAEQTQPDIVVVDITLENSSGLELIKNLKAAQPHVPALALSMHEELLYGERVMRAGGRGYLMKAEAPATVLTAIRAVLSGEVHISERLKERLLKQLQQSAVNPAATAIEHLTDRELEVYQLLGTGLSTREVAANLGVSFHTVCAHREQIKAKLGLASAAELVNHAVRWASTRRRD